MGPRRCSLLWGFHAVLAQVAVLTAGQRPPRPAGWSPAPSSSWAPTLEPGPPGDGEGSAAALAFLRTGDSERLARANCSGGVAAAAPGPGPPPALRAALRAAPEALAHAANFLNMLFQTNDIREASVAEDVEWYQALVRSLAEGHPWVRRAVLALDAHPLAPKPRLMLQATKGDGQILLQDVSSSAPSLGNLSWDNEWFNALKSQRLPALRKRVLSNDLRSLETPKWQRGDSYVGDPGHVRWSPPFLECREGRFLPTWAVTLSSAFYGLKPDLSPEFKGVVRVDVELRDVAIDQCSSGPGWFSDTHRCDLNSTQCVPQESRSFVLGRYLCRCKPGFYGAGGVASGAWAGVAGTDGGSRLGCRPCRPGCATCEDDTPCLIQEDQVLRAAVLSCQACCMLAIFLSMLVSYHFRRSKRIRTSGIILLETILFGSLLLYFPVFILYFKPSIFRCIVLRWVRMLGFAIVYGTITLKLYRVLKVFLSRTAQRAPYVSSGRVLRMLAPILLLVLWFLAAWTIGMLENARKNIPLVIRAQTNRGLHFSICGHDCWDYMMVIAEMLFLLWGSFLCYATRAVPSAFHEPRYMGIALHNELMVSAAFHVVRFLIVPSLHPDWTLLLFFAHTHGTVTMTLALLFIPKFLHTGSPLREEITAEVYEDELDMRRSGSCMNSSIASAWSERSLDPDDIREELKKLYRQLEMHKTWRMATDNPHLAQKRSSRRSLARSILRRGGAEPAESASRRSSSAKRLADASGTGPRMRDQSSRRRSSALRKSRSSEGPPREPRRGSRTPSPPEERPPAAVTDLEQSDSDSLDAAPLLCKSASAQNLSGSWQRPPPLQKSLSAASGAREAALLAARHRWHGSRQLSAPAPGLPRRTATPPRGSREEPAPAGDAKGHKRVTYAPVKSVSVDSAHPARRVRVTVRKTPPPPPVRYQSLQRSGTLGDGPEPPPGPPAQAGEEQGTAGDEPGRASPPAGKGRLLLPSAASAHVCPWELVQDEILGRKQKAAEAAESGTPGDTAATSPGPKPPPQKSFRSLGLAIKALNRSRGKSILKGKSEGSLRKRGSSRRESSGPAEASAASLGGVSPAPAAKSPEGSGQGLEAPALQHNNNAATRGEAAGWGHSGTRGQGDGAAPGPGDGDQAAEEPSAARRDAGTGGGLEPPSAGHRGAECAPGVSPVEPQEGDEAPVARAEEGEQPEGTSRSFQRRELLEEEQPPAKLPPSSVRGAAGPEARAEVCPPGALGIPAGRAALLRQEAIAPREDGEIPESPHKALEKGSSQPERVPGGRRSGSAQGELSPEGARGDSSSKPGIGPGKGSSEGDSQRSPGKEKPPELWKAVPEEAEGRRAEVCPWESREQGRSVRAEICPWDTEGARPEQEGQGSPRSGEGVEQPGMGLAGKSPALAKPSSQRAGTTESKKANVCPWEVQDEPRPKTEICPWEEAAAPSRMDRLKQDTRGTSEGEEKVRSRAAEKGKQPPAKPPPKSPSGRSQSKEKAEICPWEVESSSKAEICPWESQGSKSSDKAEICPWESQGSKSSDKAEICPWESQGSKSSDKAEICPWESQGSKSSDKAEICPWEVAEPPSNEEKPKQDKVLPLVSKSPSTSQALQKEIGGGTAGMQDRASVCPWESPDTEQLLGKPQTGSPALPKAASGRFQSEEKAEICPWDTQNVESSSKTEICPWEVAEAPSQQPKAKQGPAGGSKGDKRITRQAALTSPERSLDSRDRASVCPWESPDTEQPPGKPQTGSPALPKAASGRPQSEEKAEICPWEVESSSKAEICPWEVAEAPSGKEKPRQGKEDPSRGRKSPSTSQGLLKEVGDKTSGMRDRESICPWESPNTEQTPGKPHPGSPALPKAASGRPQSEEKAEICPWEVESSSKAEICPWESQGSKSSDKAEICPWESQGSKSSDKAEICPWESQGSKSSDKAEICPWEVTEPPSNEEKPKQDKVLPLVSKSPSTSQALQKEIGGGTAGMQDRASICPWESPDTEQLLGKPQTGSPALPKAASGRPQTEEKAEICPWEVESSSKAEICPWESQGSKSSDKAEICPWESQGSKSSDKAEICPWEVTNPQLEKGTGPRKDKHPPREASKALKDSTDRVSVCPWESPDTEQPSMKTAVGKETSTKSDSAESRKSEICPWEAAEPIGPEEEISQPGVQPQGADRASPTGTAQPAASAVPPTLLEKSRGRSHGEAEHKPLRRLLPGIQQAGAGSSPSPSPGLAEVCPWEAGEAPSAPAKPSSDTGRSSEVCPWEEESSDPPRTCPGQGRAGGSPRDGGGE